MKEEEERRGERWGEKKSGEEEAYGRSGISQCLAISALCKVVLIYTPYEYHQWFT